MTCLSDLIPAAPEPHELTRARKAAGVSQQHAAELAGLGSRQYWWSLEAGERRISPQAWSLFLLATGQHPAYKLVPKSPSETSET